MTMWSYVSSLWPSSSGSGQIRPLSPPPLQESREPEPRRKSLRVRRVRSAYFIEADSTFRHFYEDRPVLFLVTSSLAVVDYCLQGRQLNDDDDSSETASSRFDLDNDTEHTEVCLRLRRCAAVKLTPKVWCRGEDCEMALEHHLSDTRYVFGWPSSSRATASGRVIEPVWVYYVPNNNRLPHQGIVRRYGMEAHLELGWLAGSTSMEEYCSRLHIHGARFYDDVEASPEAQRAGITRRSWGSTGV